MRHFIIKLILFTLPFSILGIAGFISAWRIGHAYPLSLVISIQQKDEETIFDQSWTRTDLFHYKLHSIIERKPEIVMLGSSRNIFFRENILNRQPEAFFNGSVYSLQLNETIKYIAALEQTNSLPPIIILSLDITHFNAERISDFETVDVQLSSYRDDQRRLISSVITGIRLNRTPQVFDRIQNEEYFLYGFSARRDYTGYLNDGSTYNPYITEIDLEKHRADYENRVDLFQAGQAVSQEQLDLLDAVLHSLKQNNVTVIGLLPPYRSDFIMPMLESDDFSYLPLALEAIDTVFNAYEYPLFDYTQSKTVGGLDTEFFDPMHFGELVSMKIWLEMTLAYPLLTEYTDVEQLEAAINAADNPYYVFTPRLR